MVFYVSYATNSNELSVVCLFSKSIDGIDDKDQVVSEVTAGLLLLACGAKDVAHAVGESVSTEHDLALCDWQICVNVVLWDSLVLIDA